MKPLKNELISEQMIAEANGNCADISHFQKVASFARTIASLENLDTIQQEHIERIAIVHDISCPLCRKKYGNTNGKYQEVESEPLLRRFFADYEISEEELERIIFVVGHHHTYENVDQIDYQVLLEADFLVNADESHLSASAIENAKLMFFKTLSGIHLLELIHPEIVSRNQ